jgi:hypothetical protein
VQDVTLHQTSKMRHKSDWRIFLFIFRKELYVPCQ